MRGKLILSDKSINQSGITPADAGKTDKYRLSKVTNQDHPRGCGENALTNSDLQPNMG